MANLGSIGTSTGVSTGTVSAVVSSGPVVIPALLVDVSVGLQLTAPVPVQGTPGSGAAYATLTDASAWATLTEQ